MKLNPLYKKFLPVLILPFIFGIGIFGYRALGIVLSGWLGAFAVAFSFSKIRKLKMDQSFWITGILTSYSLPVHLPFFAVFIAAAFGQFFAKEVFGGFGANVFNPALVGRVFIMLSFPLYFTGKWFIPQGYSTGFTHWTADAVTGATSLMKFRTTKVYPDFFDSLFGKTSGSLCETSAILFILIMFYMYKKKIGKFTFSFSFLGSLAVFSTIGWFFWPTYILPPHLQIVTGGILAGSAFYCTDPVTAPRNKNSQIFSGILLGFIVLAIRSFSSFPEGFMFGLLIINMFSPLFDLLFTGKFYEKKG